MSVYVVLSGILQDHSFVLLAKSRELMVARNWPLSMRLLACVQAEVEAGAGSGGTTTKLLKLIHWETLLVKINRVLEEWPAPDVGKSLRVSPLWAGHVIRLVSDKKELLEECAACLGSTESVLPRTEIIEQCTVCLLNLGHWDFLAGLEKRWNCHEIVSALTVSCQDFVKFKGGKKLSRDLWEIGEYAHTSVIFNEHTLKNA